jgi:tRNA modification GTPase
MSKEHKIDDTIAAISTPLGENGIGIIRISGPLSLSIADNIFRGKNLKKPSEHRNYSLIYGHIHNSQKDIDEVLLSVMRKPFTYTREDTVEINCHSGSACLSQILDIVLHNGARLAEPGEFTKKAFLSGRIDLIQAEAVCDIIASKTKESLDIAQRQLKGGISSRIKSSRKQLIESVSELEARMNFPEENLPDSGIAFLGPSLIEIQKDLSEIIDSSYKGIIFREGATAVICGKTNVGKSSLMNSLLRHDRVIVSPAAGTTRDTIEELVNIKGIPLRIIDTAGIIQSKNNITKESVSRSIDYIDKASLVLLVLDNSKAFAEEDLCIINTVRHKKKLIVLNKSDLPGQLSAGEIREHFHENIVLNISAKFKTGIDRLEDAIYNMFFSGGMTTDSICLSNARHIQSLKQALVFLDSAMKGICEKRPAELIVIDIKDAADALGMVTGEVFTEDMLDAIFNKFCIGK